MGEALPVDLQGGRHLTGFGVLILVGGHFFDDQQRTRRSHGVVGQKDPLIVRGARVNHRCGRTGFTGGQQVQVLAHLGLGRTRTISHLDSHHTVIATTPAMASTTRTPTRIPTSMTRFLPRPEEGVDATLRPAGTGGPGIAGVTGGAGIGAALTSFFSVPINCSS